MNLSQEQSQTFCPQAVERSGTRKRAEPVTKTCLAKGKKKTMAQLSRLRAKFILVRFRGVSWTKIDSLDRVTSITFSPTKVDDAFLTTETDGLWHSANIHATSPVFTRVANYPFRQPERVIFNPYNPSEIWLTSFGHGLTVGNLAATVIAPFNAIITITGE